MAPAGVRDWIGGARLRTLPLGVAGVAAGTGASVVALGNGQWHGVRALACLAVAVLLQVGVNYANDYSDGIRGTDRYRVGPSRLTGSGAARPRTVLTVALVCFALAALVGLAVVVVTQHWWLLAVGAAAIVAAWFYTGGKHPYGYHALGEVAVFLFFGLAGTAGTEYVLAGTVSTEGWLGAVAVGSGACAVLMVNNVRDRGQDAQAGKRTLAVVLGERGSRIAFCVLMLVPFVIVWFFTLFYPLAPRTYFVLLAAIPACAITLTAKSGRELILALQLASFATLAIGVGLGAAFAF